MEAISIAKICVLSGAFGLALYYFKAWRWLRILILKIKGIAIRHGINPVTFLFIWIVTTGVRYGASFAAAYFAIEKKNTLATLCLISNRLAAFVIPAYIIWATRKKRFRWWVYGAYIALWVIGGTFEIVGPRWFLEIQANLWRVFLEILGIQ